ncbi:hypothetical protein DSM112329_03338 [Paraconexibacter sp. AEG42_29]|uniref:Orc1-like AAA ATPase domain-containing protein n=1 Tax=Paraconexibacter sp. AEG42_29 TaxID=2997339 RepID=A0AAU7AYR9_9ACTN
MCHHVRGRRVVAHRATLVAPRTRVEVTPSVGSPNGVRYRSRREDVGGDDGERPAVVELLGREAERAQLQALVDDARHGRSAVLAVRGLAGSGKSALLQDTLAHASGLRTLSAVGLEGEAQFAYAVLQELVDPILELRVDLPPAQGRALAAALALEDGLATPFAVAAAVLSLLAAAAEHQPLLVVVDDLQWADEASRAALLFAARRLSAEGVLILLGVRDGEAGGALPGELPELPLAGLPDAAARQLLAGHDLAPAVAARLIAATDGSPLALLEVPALLTAAQRAGTAPLEDPLPIGQTLQRAFRRRLDALPAPSRRALLVAACADDARADTVLAAVERLGERRDALAAAEDAGLVVHEGRRLQFCHPLQRAASVLSAPPSERRAAHRALADVLPEGSTARAWQLAAAAEGADGAAAAALAGAAGDARGRGAYEEAFRAFARAADLQPDDEARARLLLEAAGTAVVASRVTEGIACARRGADLARDPLLRSDLRAMGARAELRAGLATGGREVLISEGEALIDEHPARAAIVLLEAAVVDMTSGRLHRMVELAGRARAAAEEALPPLAFLAGVLVAEAQLALGETEAGDTTLAGAEAVLRAYTPGTGPPEVVAMAAHSSLWVERFERAEQLFDRLIAGLREASAVADLIYPLAARSHLGFRLGRWPSALADAAEAVRLAEVTGQELAQAHALAALGEVEAALGRDADAFGHATRSVSLGLAQGAAVTVTYGNGALTLLALGRGDPGEAVERGLAAERAERRTDNDEAQIVRYLPDLVEALWRVGRIDEARERIAGLERQGRRPGHTWTAAVTCRLQGLVCDDEEVDDRFARALALHDQTPQPFEAARTRLLHGERLRRLRRPSDARRPLRGALATFERLGAAPWVERAQGELRATGGAEPAPQAVVAAAATSAAIAELTPQELQIALHAARGMTNQRGRCRPVPGAEDRRAPSEPDVPQARDPAPRRAPGGADRGRLKKGAANMKPAFTIASCRPEHAARHGLPNAHPVERLRHRSSGRDDGPEPALGGRREGVCHRGPLMQRRSAIVSAGGRRPAGRCRGARTRGLRVRRQDHVHRQQQEQGAVRVRAPGVRQLHCPLLLAEREPAADRDELLVAVAPGPLGPEEPAGAELVGPAVELQSPAALPRVAVELRHLVVVDGDGDALAQDALRAAEGPLAVGGLRLGLARPRLVVEACHRPGTGLQLVHALPPRLLHQLELAGGVGERDQRRCLGALGCHAGAVPAVPGAVARAGCPLTAARAPII